MPASDDDDRTAAVLDGRYRLIESLGRGGSAEVHRAEDLQLGRIVAIKMLHPDGDTVSAADRVHVETAVLASLNHPSLVTLFDAQLDPGRAQYLVMEYVEGPTLSARLRRSPLASGDAAVLAHDLAEALSVVHSRGIVHRDVKPSNVLLAPPVRRDRPWAAKLADFGIAHVLEDPRLTTPGLVIGTATYMAPEQVSGGELTAAADIYSLGLVLLETLTGEPVFRGETAVDTALARLASPPAIPAELGGAWTTLLTRMTATDAADRPTADEVALAAAELAGAATIATPPTRTDEVETAAMAAPSAAHPTATLEHPTGPTRVLPADLGASAAPRTSTRPISRRAIALAAVLLLIAVAGVGAWAVGTAQSPSSARLTNVLRTHEPVPTSTPEPVVSNGGGNDAGNSGNNGSGNNGKGDENKGSGNNGKGDENKGKGGGSNGKGNSKG